jgi:hypothetical protein
MIQLKKLQRLGVNVGKYLSFCCSNTKKLYHSKKHHSTEEDRMDFIEIVSEKYLKIFRMDMTYYFPTFVFGI